MMAKSDVTRERLDHDDTDPRCEHPASRAGDEVVGLGRPGRPLHARGQARAGPVPARAARDRRDPGRRGRAAVRAAARPRAEPPRAAARRARARRGRLDRSGGPRRARAREEPSRSRPPAPRRARPAAGRRRAAGRRSRRRGGGAGRAGGRRGADPVRRRHEHLGQPRGARRRGAPGRLGRPLAPGPRARRRPGRAARARAGGRARARPRAPARRAGLDARALPRLLHPLDARRLDRDPLLRHAVRPLRRHRRAHPRRPRGHPGGRAGHAARARHLDGPERPRDGARQRGPARGDHRGDRPCPAAARRADHPRLSVPGLGAGARRHARHRRQRGAAVRHARVRRLRDALLVRHAQGPDAAGPAEVARAADLSRAPARLRRRRDVPVVHRLRGPGAPRRRTAQADRADREPPRRPVHRRVARRALRPEEVRHPVHPRLPARPRHPRRRVGDRGAVERAAARSTTR